MMRVMIATAKAVQIIHGNCRKEKRKFDLLAAKHPTNHRCFGFDTGEYGASASFRLRGDVKHAKTCLRGLSLVAS